MNLKTFLPPTSIDAARVPEPGDPAPTALGNADGERRGQVVSFLRHTGCPFAEATFRAMREAADASPEVRFVAVSHVPADATDRWCEDLGGSGRVEVVVDQGRSLYAGWGVGRTGLGHFMGRRSLGAVARLAREGVRNRHPHGSRWQGAGTFAVDRDGVVCWRHLPLHAGDLPDLDAASRSTRGGA